MIWPLHTKCLVVSTEPANASLLVRAMPGLAVGLIASFTSEDGKLSVVRSLIQGLSLNRTKLLAHIGTLQGHPSLWGIILIHALQPTHSVWLIPHLSPPFLTQVALIAFLLSGQRSLFQYKIEL